MTSADSRLVHELLLFYFHHAAAIADLLLLLHQPSRLGGRSSASFLLLSTLFFCRRIRHEFFPAGEALACSLFRIPRLLQDQIQILEPGSSPILLILCSLLVFSLPSETLLVAFPLLRHR